MFTFPLGNELVVITNPEPAAEIVIVKFAVAVKAGWLESLTATVSLSLDTALDGVPPIVPTELFNESPVGKAPLVINHVYGAVPPVAAKVAEYDAFTWPPGNAAVVISTAPPAFEEFDEFDAEVLELPCAPPQPATNMQITTMPTSSRRSLGYAKLWNRFLERIIDSVSMKP